MSKVIAIDGPSGVGKSSVSKALASALDWTYLDTGAMYRTVTLAWLRQDQRTPLYEDSSWLESLNLDFRESEILLDGEDVSGEIRGSEVTSRVSKVAANPGVRRYLTEMQRTIASRRPCILDGRDIGTVVFPNAFLKVFMVASPEIRARRRWLQLGGHSAEVTLQQILDDQEERDRKDRNRETAPLRKAADAFRVDTDHNSEQEVVEIILAEARNRLAVLT